MDVPQSPKRALIYTRMSRDATGEGLGVARQLEDCERHVRSRDWTVVRHESDNSISAYGKVRRPAFERVIEAIRAREVDVVVCWHIDRLTRRPLDMEMFIELWEQTGVEISPVTGHFDLTSDVGRMHARFMAAVVRGEVERKSERQKRANAQRRAAGKPWRSGWASFGYDRDKNIVPEQAELIRSAAAEVLAGASLKSIARSWVDSGITTPRSSKGAAGWTHNGVKSILLNPVNAGISTYRGGEIGIGVWEPILPEETFRQLQALLGDPSRRTYAGNGRRAENLLSGIATCARCGSNVVAGSSNGRKVYKCSNPSGDHITTWRAEVDAFVLKSLTSREAFASSSVLPDTPTYEGQDQLMSELANLDRREAVITERFAANAIPEATWSRALDATAATRASIVERIARSQEEMRSHSARASTRVASFLNMPLGGQRATLGAVADIQLHPRERRRNVPIEAQVSVWAKDPRRLDPLISGTHPDSIKRRQAIIEEREDAKLAALGPDFSDEP